MTTLQLDCGTTDHSRLNKEERSSSVRHFVGGFIHKEGRYELLVWEGVPIIYGEAEDGEIVKYQDELHERDDLTVKQGRYLGSGHDVGRVHDPFSHQLEIQLYFENGTAVHDHKSLWFTSIEAVESKLVEFFNSDSDSPIQYYRENPPERESPEEYL